MRGAPQDRNRELLRAVNETIRQVDIRFGLNGSYHLLCECGSGACNERVDVPATVFDELMGDGERFLVAPAHAPANGVAASTYAIVALPVAAP